MGSEFVADPAGDVVYRAAWAALFDEWTGKEMAVYRDKTEMPASAPVRNEVRLAAEIAGLTGSSWTNQISAHAIQAVIHTFAPEELPVRSDGQTFIGMQSHTRFQIDEVGMPGQDDKLVV